MTNLDSIFKSRDIALPTKVRLVKAMVFPVVMYGCENWTVKKAESQRIDAFELWCWRRLLESLGLQGDPTNPFWRSALGFLWRNDAKAETPVLWPPQAKSWLIGKDSDAGRDWGQEEKGTTEDEDITLLTKVHLVKAIVFPVVMYGCENWTIKKAEHWRTDAF